MRFKYRLMLSFALLISIPLSIIYAAAMTGPLNIGVTVLTVATALSVIASYHLASQITKPLDNVVQSIESIAAGNFNTFIDSPGKAPEIKALTDSFNHMTMALSFQQAELKEMNEAIIETTVNLLEIKDKYTVGHSYNVRNLSLKIAERLGLDETARETLTVAATLHDIGKIGIDSSILNKPDLLTPEEYETIKTHPVLGFKALGSSSKLAEVGQIVLHHHERYDGKGYPSNLSGEGIPLLARIISIADAFDAMHSDRPYRKGLPMEAIIQTVKEERGKQFDPAVADALLSIVENKPSPFRTC